MGMILKAANFAAKKHARQRRKDEDGSPYINHPIQVAEILWRVGNVRDTEVLAAAILHDTLEDTNTTYVELAEAFGQSIANIVSEVSDDKSLPKQMRKDLQEEHAPLISTQARLVKLADKIANLADICFHPPAGWSLDRKVEYLHWAGRVVAGMRSTNAGLEAEFDRVYSEAENYLYPASPQEDEQIFQ